MPLAGNTILVVEDAPESLKVTARLLRADGHDVHLASTAEQALIALETIRPDLMLVDLQLPGMSGLDLIRRVKEDVQLNEITVVALTACVTEEARQMARDAGCDGYLTKPIEPRILTGRVREYLKQRCDASPVCATDAEPEDDSHLILESEMEDLRRSFITDGIVQSLRMLASLESQFDATTASRLVHQWVGTGSLLGFAGISRLARGVENLLRMPPWNPRQLRVSLTAWV
jgi:two-component system, cell cycle response regulator DivK